jgi:hypothetical protein
MGRSKKAKKSAVSDEMEARITSASDSELEAIMAEAGRQYETAKEHLDNDPAICAARQALKDLTETDRTDAKEARAISKRAYVEQMTRGHKVTTKVFKPLLPAGADQ